MSTTNNQLEKGVEKYFVAEMKKAMPPGTQIIKYEARRGEPDRICLLPGGRAIFVELKRPGKNLRDEQERAFERLMSLGFEVHLINSRELVDSFVKCLV